MLFLKQLICIISIFIFLFQSSQIFAEAPRAVDYVIVGVGTAGALIAKHLSDSGASVVGIQNGPNVIESPFNKYSKFAALTVVSGLIGPPFYQKNETVPQVNAGNQRLPWVMAIPLGGATSVNAGAYCRGTPEVYSQWEALDGPLWSVNRIYQIYKDLEHYYGLTTNPSSRGYVGPISVRQVLNPIPLANKFVQAVSAGTGIPIVLDYNDSNTPIGVTANLQYTQSGVNGEFRFSSANAFLNGLVMNQKGKGVNGRKLTILFNSTALRIIWSGNKAIGIEYYSQGKIKQVYAVKGVIISAGVNSSTFLMHSGVGPAALLNSLGIPVIYDNPNVGQGLLDQPQLLLLFASNPNDSFWSFELSSVATHFNSMLIQNNPVFGPIFNRLNSDPTGVGFASHLIGNNSLFSEIAWLPDPFGDPTVRALRFSTINPVPGLTVALFDLVQPKSRGSIVINSANPFAPGVMDLGMLSNPDDLTLYKNGFQVYIKGIIAALQAIDPQYQLLYPDPSIIDNDAALTAFIQNNIASNMSFEGQNRMAPLAQGGVVDVTGHVYGVQNLIVADDSIVPFGMDGSSMASAYLIGENISRIILNQA